MTTQRRERLKFGSLGALLGLATGALTGVFATVKVYGADVASMHAAQRQHCVVVNLEKRAMLRSHNGALARDEALFGMLNELCDATGHCTSRQLPTEAKLTSADFPDEECR